MKQKQHELNETSEATKNLTHPSYLCEIRRNMLSVCLACHIQWRMRQEKGGGGAKNATTE